MDVIDLKDIGNEGREDERSEENREEKEQEETSFTENTRDNYDNTRSRINTKTPTQSKTNEGLDENDHTDLEKQIQDHAIKKAVQRFDAIQAFESMTDMKFSVTHGDSSKELIDNISDIKYSEKGKLIALKYKGEDVKLTAKGKLDGRSANTDNKENS